MLILRTFEIKKWFILAWRGYLRQRSWNLPVGALPAPEQGGGDAPYYSLLHQTGRQWQWLGYSVRWKGHLEESMLDKLIVNVENKHICLNFINEHKEGKKATYWSRSIWDWIRSSALSALYPGAGGTSIFLVNVNINNV